MSADEKGYLFVQTTPVGARLVYQEVPLEPGPSTITQEALRRGTPVQLGTLGSLCRDLFLEYGPLIEFGPVLAGAIFEFRLPAPPEAIFVKDGYLNVRLPAGGGHLHLGIAESEQNDRLDPSGVLARARMCTRAALFEGYSPGGDAPCVWGVRLWNGEGVQMITFFVSPEAGPRVISELRERYLY